MNMENETVEDLANEIANWLGIYGGCKVQERGEDGCEESEKNIFCCRQGFTMMLEDRIRAAVENDIRLVLIKSMKNL